MVKLFGWEEKTLKMVNEKREEELYYLLRMKVGFPIASFKFHFLTYE